MIEIRQTEQYAEWFSKLRDTRAKGHIDIRIRRLSLGHTGDIRSVGQGVSELRIHYAPGYGVYFARQGTALVILLAGGDNQTRARDILCAKHLARDL